MIIYGKTDDQLPMLSHYIEVTKNKYLMLFKMIVCPSIESLCKILVQMEFMYPVQIKFGAIYRQAQHSHLIFHTELKPFS